MPEITLTVKVTISESAYDDLVDTHNMSDIGARDPEELVAMMVKEWIEGGVLYMSTFFQGEY